MDPIDHLIVAMSGVEPVFDEVTHAFLCNSRDDLLERLERRGGLLEAKCLGRDAPHRQCLRSLGLEQVEGGIDDRALDLVRRRALLGSTHRRAI